MYNHNTVGNNIRDTVKKLTAKFRYRTRGQKTLKNSIFESKFNIYTTTLITNFQVKIQ